jgi:hypothetical protein
MSKSPFRPTGKPKDVEVARLQREIETAFRSVAVSITEGQACCEANAALVAVSVNTTDLAATQASADAAQASADLAQADADTNTTDIAAIDTRVTTLEGAGGGLNVLTRSVTEIEITDTTTETNLVNYTIPADTLDENGRRVVITQNLDVYNSGASRYFIVRLYIGGVEVFADRYPLSNSGRRRPVRIRTEIISVSTSVQMVRMTFIANATNSLDPDTGTAGGLDGTTAATFEVWGADSTADRTAAMSFTMSIAHSAAAGPTNFRTRQQAYQIHVE